VKSRVRRDLPTAIEQAYSGRRFVPSLDVLFELAAGGHAMLLYGGDEGFVENLSLVLDLALRRGDATCVIATEHVRAALADRLHACGWNVSGSSGHERYLAVDADEALNRLMRNGLPDGDELAKIVAELDQYRLAVAGPVSRLTVFGNMVVSLSLSGNNDAVVAVERLWSALTRSLPFLTVCAYTTSCFHDGVPGLWPGICEEHWALSHATDV
jgi:hypothetical protein